MQSQEPHVGPVSMTMPALPSADVREMEMVLMVLQALNCETQTLHCVPITMTTAVLTSSQKEMSDMEAHKHFSCPHSLLSLTPRS